MASAILNPDCSTIASYGYIYSRLHADIMVINSIILAMVYKSVYQSNWTLSKMDEILQMAILYFPHNES